MEQSVRTPLSGSSGPGFKSQAGQRLSSLRRFSSVPPSKCRDMREFGLSPRCKRVPRSSRILRIADWQSVKDVSGQLIWVPSSMITQPKKFEVLDP